MERTRSHSRQEPGREFVRHHHGPGSGYRRYQRYLARRKAKAASGEQITEAAPPLRREDLRGTWAMEREAELTGPKAKERAEQVKLHGLEAAESINDRSMTLFRRGRWGMQGGTFIGVPFLEDMRELGGQDVVFVGAPLDTGTTFRPGTRFGPQAIRRHRASAAHTTPPGASNCTKCSTWWTPGDIQVIPANIEKSFDQIANAIGYIHERAVFPVVLGGDHSIGYPDIRGIAPYIDGNIGIIHFDRHSDLSETTWTSGCTARPSSTRRTSRTRPRPISCRSASAAGPARRRG